jgi:hypothetical protein
MGVMVDIALIAGALVVPLALLDGWLTLSARRRRSEAVDRAVDELLAEPADAGVTGARSSAGPRTTRS